MSKVLFISLLAFVGLTSVQKESSRSFEAYNSEAQSRFSVGIFAGASGAPGESTCYDCHDGSLQNGDAQH
ncbi:MAG: hypothetical protein P8P74_04760 [Crocinitomicaceae bacterium]|nr:hypothetical protein [Crocinitomicaceae bacterium]